MAIDNNLGSQPFIGVNVLNINIIQSSNNYNIVCCFLYTLVSVCFCEFFASKGYPFYNILDFTTAGDWDCVAAVERLPTLPYSVDFIFLSFGIMGFIVELWNY